MKPSLKLVSALLALALASAASAADITLFPNEKDVTTEGNWTTYSDKNDMPMKAVVFEEGRKGEAKLLVPPSAADWSGFSRIVLRLYNPVANDKKLVMMITSSRHTGGNPFYYIKTDWVGWKNVVLTPAMRKIEPPERIATVDELIFWNHFGPDDDTNTTGMRYPVGAKLGIESITVVK